jgi:hypothetical protein
MILMLVAVQWLMMAPGAVARFYRISVWSIEAGLDESIADFLCRQFQFVWCVRFLASSIVLWGLFHSFYLPYHDYSPEMKRELAALVVKADFSSSHDCSGASEGKPIVRIAQDRIRYAVVGRDAIEFHSGICSPRDQRGQSR